MTKLVKGGMKSDANCFFDCYSRLGLRVGLAAHATVNEYQEQQADRFCQIDPNYCK